METRRSKTHFEQVPIEDVKKLTGADVAKETEAAQAGEESAFRSEEPSAPEVRTTP